MTIVAAVLGILGVLGLSTAGWQHARYLSARRERVQDLQPLLHSSRVLHVVTFLRVADDANVIEEVRKLRDLLETRGKAKVVYAGRGVLNAVVSKQIPNVDWNAVLLVQYGSREDYDAVAASEAYRTALSRFDASYSHGMKRSALMNLAIPQLLLGVRLVDALRRVPSPHPLLPAEPGSGPRERGELLAKFDRLDQVEDLGRDAVVIVNLLQPGTPEQRAADSAYTRRMMGLFATGGYGPTHFGAAVPLEGEARFQNVGIVYYPGIDHMKALIHSSFMARIGGDKQPGDSLAVVTVPILSRL